MKKIQKNFLIISIASALILFGMTFFLIFRYGYHIGLPIGLSSFLTLIAIMLVLNAKAKEKSKNKNKTNKNKTKDKES